MIIIWLIFHFLCYFSLYHHQKLIINNTVIFMIFISNSLLHLLQIIVNITIMTIMSFQLLFKMSSRVCILQLFQMIVNYFNYDYYYSHVHLSLVQISLDVYIHSWRCTLHGIRSLAVIMADFRSVDLCSSPHWLPREGLTMQKKMNWSLFWFWKL